MAELFAWETAPGFAVHILNYNDPNMTKGWIRKSYPIGPQKMRFELDEKIMRVRALRAETDLQYQQNGRMVEFVEPKVDDYEIAALFRAQRPIFARMSGISNTARFLLAAALALKRA
jgi:hypothetical protein